MEEGRGALGWHQGIIKHGMAVCDREKSSICGGGVVGCGAGLNRARDAIRFGRGVFFSNRLLKKRGMFS